jgi:hypothetical protein
MARMTIAVTMGDPAGIGPEIIVKALGRPGSAVEARRAAALGNRAPLGLRGGSCSRCRGWTSEASGCGGSHLPCALTRRTGVPRPLPQAGEVKTLAF